MIRLSAISAVLLCLLLGAAGGCSTLKAPKFPWQKSEEIEYKVPQKMVVTWKDTVRSHPTDPPTRGFGGRVHFYDESNAPCQVQGEFVVYGFVDTPEFQVDRDKPERKYVFEAENLDSHYSVSKIGDSYSFWIPWDHPSGPQLDITLAPFFRTLNGQMVVGDQSRQMLPGVALPKQENSPTENIPTPAPGSEISQVGYHQDPQNYGPRSEMKTTTIPLNDSMSQRIRNSNQTQFQPVGASTYALSNQGQMNPAPARSPTHGGWTSPAAYPNHQHTHLPIQQNQQNAFPPLGQNRSQTPITGGMPSEYYVTPGINLQSYKPAFTNSQEYSQFLSTGHSTALAPHVPAVGYPPGSPQAPATQTGQPSVAGLPRQQSPSLWPPGLPQPQIPQGSTTIQPAASMMSLPPQR